MIRAPVLYATNMSLFVIAMFLASSIIWFPHLSWKEPLIPLASLIAFIFCWSSVSSAVAFTAATRGPRLSRRPPEEEPQPAVMCPGAAAFLLCLALTIKFGYNNELGRIPWSLSSPFWLLVEGLGFGGAVSMLSSMSILDAINDAKPRVDAKYEPASG
jgi:hypothetical protein